MNIRNAKRNEAGSVDCEIEHPTYGWIPFTAVAGDPNSDEVLAEITRQGIVVAPYTAKVKSPAELEAEASAAAKKTIAQVRADIFPDLLDFVAGLPGAPANIKAARDRVNAEKLKVR